MKLKNNSFAISIMLALFSVATGCATSSDVISATTETSQSSQTPEKKELEIKTAEESTIRNSESVQNKINRMSEFKVVYLPENPGE